MSSSAAAVTSSTRGSARPTAADFFTIAAPSPITPFSELPEELDEAPRRPKTTARMEIAKLRKEVRILTRSLCHELIGIQNQTLFRLMGEATKAIERLHNRVSELEGKKGLPGHSSNPIELGDSDSEVEFVEREEKRESGKEGKRREGAGPVRSGQRASRRKAAQLEKIRGPSLDADLPRRARRSPPNRGKSLPAGM